jgi:hypothetical protein
MALPPFITLTTLLPLSHRDIDYKLIAIPHHSRQTSMGSSLMIGFMGMVGIIGI